MNNNNNNNIACPVDGVTVDENKVRVTAFCVVVLSACFLLTNSWPILVFLLIDFLARVLNLNNYSLLAIASGSVVKQAGAKPKPVARAPKKFAALVGLLFLSLTLIAFLITFILVAKLLASVVLVFASLEAFAGFCAGCYVYNWLKRIKVSK
ncbi:hypothetical protein BEL04_05340 [Mucilaginibacter sp. PPCGB 2223]|uniref:DUF4395 domain-containing protein n=1 Tax=Mucilaginibacter sp. PPCGB 2223 TaxID=1886027 RepID=UPI000824FAA7|nr:DUF4395 domain-containing protein [Mucilaginibacter sp. PPCGB 2223]OCX53718.1 hypothetical protein BEL04_05340 [Mucilaginibacter sp. PPCGB 2223]